MHDYPFVFNLTWLIPLPTALAFFAIILFTNPKKRLSSNVAIAAVVVAWILSWAVAFAFFLKPELVEEPINIAVPWLPIADGYFSMGVAVDAVTAGMLFMVGFVLTMIFIYSSGYMTFPGHLDPEQFPEVAKEGLDPRYSRFFAYISLFATGMLGLVVADNLLMLFIFWEIMGLCSYLLIGFWFEKTYPDPNQITPKQAGLKAFLTTRVGDVLFMMGLIFLFIHAGTLNFQAIFKDAHFLEELATSTVTLPIFGAVSWAALISILIFWGAIGKSAQFPLHVWLPDAMEGPTPVSALIHAATMVSAGVYLIVRMAPLFAASSHAATGALPFVAFIGAFTALFAATIGVAQKDIKKVLAYSTISQLGYMFAALGIGAWVAAIIHLLVHAFFKALLFLGSGSVIHGVEHGHHHVHEHGHGHDDEHGHEEYFDPQDMFNMGGLLKRMPITGWTFIAGALSLAAFPFITAGFWSKDEILAHAWDGGHMAVYWALAIGAFLTAFYTFRQVFLTFFGEPRTEAAAHAPESVRAMTWPLVALAFFAIFGGFVAVPKEFPIFGKIASDFMLHLMEMQGEIYPFLEVEPAKFNWTPALISMVLALSGIVLAWLVYGWKPLKAGQPDPLKRWLGPVYTVLEKKYYFDELYHLIAVRPTLWLASFFARFDRGVIDRIVNWVGAFGRWLAAALRKWFDERFIDGVVNIVGMATTWTGAAVRLIQTGQVQTYLLILLLSVAVLLLLIPLR
ncbi:MAG TPA: NADH-quinone oxidoreductase subunit L [Anaerolineae bacterium]|nr:NADH-quinone oxidoreductase subunit L [Anaerolineae bacterium]